MEYLKAVSNPILKTPTISKTKLPWLEIGSHSNIPCTIPKIIDSNIVLSYQRFDSITIIDFLIPIIGSLYPVG